MQNGHRLILSGIVTRAARYIIVGGSVNAGLYALYLMLTSWLLLPPLAATSIVYATGVILSYLGNALWAFQRSRSHLDSVWRYIAVYFLGYLVQAGTLVSLTELTPAPHQLAQLLAMAAAAASIFFLLNFWVFGSKQAPTEQQ